MVKKWIALLCSTLFMLTALTACNSPVYNQAEANVADVKIKAAKMRKKSDVDARISSSPLTVKDGMYVDTTPINIDNQPGWLRNHIVIRGDQLPFSYYSRTILTGAGQSILAKYQNGMDQTVSISMNYSGSVKGALELLAAKTGYRFTVHRQSVYWQSLITRTFDISFMPGSSNYLMGSDANSNTSGSNSSYSGGNTAGNVSNYVSGDNSTNEYSSLKGTLSVWTDLETTLKQLLSSDGKVIVSQSTTTVTVRDKPSNVELIEQYIHNLNANLSKQVLVKVQVIQVDLQNDYNFGIDWNLIIKAFHQSPFVINGNYGTPVSIAALSPQNSNNPGPNTTNPVPVFGTTGSGNVPSYTILFNALNQQGKTSIVSEPRVVCLNNQVSVIRIVTSQGYVASIQNTSLAGSSSGGANTNIGTVTSQITPGNIVTGLTLYILPKIMKNKVYLQVNADLSNQTALVSVGPDTSTQVQLPTVVSKSFNQRSMIQTGDTMILSGFRSVQNQVGANQFLNSQALGGKAAAQTSTETIVLITPIILHGSV